MTTTTTSIDGTGDGEQPMLKKGPWSAAEDAVLMEYVNKHGEGNWNAVQRNTGLQRCGKSCRLRWANHLRPNLKKGAFSIDEERLIIDLHSKLGNKWARISSHLPGRTDNEIKNYWNTRVKRRLRQGLPLYPSQNNSNSTQTPKTSSLQPYSFQQNNNHNTFSLFNPVSLPSSLFSLHHPPPFLSPQLVMRYPNTFSSRLVSSQAQMGTFQFSSTGVGVGVGSGYGFESGQVFQPRFGSEGLSFSNPNGNFELPSNQHDQNVTINHQEVIDNNKVNNNNDNPNPNVGRTKSGLLDDLLQEAQIKVAGRGIKREREDYGLQWDDPTSENSFTGIKKEEPEGQQQNSGNDDLSNILDLIPSLVRAPGWCNDGGGSESPIGQSATSVVSSENNYDELDMMPQPPPLPALSPSDYEDNGGDWNPISCNWDNLPRIC
ncbi:uncharacterized protein LOC141657041 [Silene latifolia]|uniref:uncharacterized protein LOC141657041 n=1 Tax=Silene latifolia TaxID=37657 RepID=UPI003D77DE1F